MAVDEKKDSWTIHLKQTAEFSYLKTTLEFEAETSLDIDLILFRTILVQALKSLFGDLGAALQVDVLRYDSLMRQAILRVPNRGLVQLWSSLSWYSEHKDYRCRFHIHKISSCLLSLSTDSRTFQHQVMK